MTVFVAGKGEEQQRLRGDRHRPVLPVMFIYECYSSASSCMKSSESIPGMVLKWSYHDV